MIHVAVLLKPFVDLVLSGEKTVECRMTKHARAPFESIEPGERIYFKQSAGPFRAIAVAEHVLFESGLTPARVREIKRDYNHLLHGPDEFWAMKSDSRYLTLIWLRDIQPADTGPALRPLQGKAWVSLPEEPAWRMYRSLDCSFATTITAGNLRNSSLYAREALDSVPAWSIGGPNRLDEGQPVTLILHDGPTVESDIVGPRKAWRTRVWGAWFRHHDARPGDRVVFTPLDEQTYAVGLVRRVTR